MNNSNNNGFLDSNASGFQDDEDQQMVQEPVNKERGFNERGSFNGNGGFGENQSLIKYLGDDNEDLEQEDKILCEEGYHAPVKSTRRQHPGVLNDVNDRNVEVDGSSISKRQLNKLSVTTRKDYGKGDQIDQNPPTEQQKADTARAFEPSSQRTHVNSASNQQEQEVFDGYSSIQPFHRTAEAQIEEVPHFDQMIPLNGTVYKPQSLIEIRKSKLDININTFLRNYVKPNAPENPQSQSDSQKAMVVFSQANIALNSPAGVLIEEYEKFYLGWCGLQRSEQLPPLQHALLQFFGENYSIVSYTSANVHASYERIKFTLLRLLSAFYEKKICTNLSIRGKTYEREFAQLSTAIWDAQYLALLNNRFQSSRSDKEPATGSSVDLFRHQGINKTKLSDIQSFLLHLLEQLCIQRLRRKGDMLYVEITDTAGFGTCAWKPFITIRKFITSVTKKETRFDQWCNMVSGNVANTAVNYLREAEDSNIQEYESDWGIIAFKDVLYISHCDKWYKHSDPKKPINLTAQIYIDQLFDDKLDPENLLESAGGYNPVSGTCNPLLKLLKDQKYTEDQMFIFLALGMGRNFYKVNELENWEMLTFLYGLANTGKSTIISTISEFFQHDEVARLGNNVEETFGLESIYNKKFAAASDVTKNFRLGTGDLLSMTTGEMTAINRKNHLALHVKWFVPLFFAGNEFPYRWVDKKGNLLRRFFIPDFLEKIVRDNSIPRKLKACRPTIYRLCNLAYLKLVHALGPRGDLWSIMPQRFKDNRIHLLKNNSPLLAFIIEQNEISLVPDEAGYILCSRFIDNFKKWCKDHEANAKDECNPERMKEVLTGHNLDLVKERKVWPIGSSTMKNDSFVTGLREIA